MNNWADSAPVIGIFVLFSVIAVSMTINDVNQERTKREAIKAGLVQDDKGHWVRPEIESTNKLVDQVFESGEE